MIGWKACKRVNGGYKKFSTGGIGGSKYTEFEVGKTYSLDGNPEICKNGYHFYRPEDFVFGITLFGEDTVFIEIETSGEVIRDTEKGVSSTITVLRYIPKKEWKRKIDGSSNSGSSNSGDGNSGSSNSGDGNSGSSNSGDGNSGSSNSGSWNSGDRNSGSWNSGDRNSGSWNSGSSNSGSSNSGSSNSGDRNSGYWNSGDRNSGSWNSGDRNSGYFNIETPKTILVFGKDCQVDDWENSTKPDFLFFEIKKGQTYKEAFTEAYNAADEKEKQQLEALPNFDWEIFSEISGVPVPVSEGNK